MPLIEINSVVDDGLLLIAPTALETTLSLSFIDSGVIFSQDCKNQHEAMLWQRDHAVQLSVKFLQFVHKDTEYLIKKGLQLMNDLQVHSLQLML